ncbi:uncharacterized protein ACIBXB_009869 [Morphnus guianensis]
MRRGQPPGAILCEALSHFRPREEGSGSGRRLSRGGGRGGGAAGQRLKGSAGSLLPPAFLPRGPPPRWMAAAAASSVLPLGGDGAGAGPAGPGSEAAAMEGRRRLWRLVGGTARREGAEELVGRSAELPGEARTRQRPSPAALPAEPAGAVLRQARPPAAVAAERPSRDTAGAAAEESCPWMYLLQLACLGSSWHISRLAVVRKRTLYSQSAGEVTCSFMAFKAPKNA